MVKLSGLINFAVKEDGINIRAQIKILVDNHKPATDFYFTSDFVKMGGLLLITIYKQNQQNPYIRLLLQQDHISPADWSGHPIHKVVLAIRILETIRTIGNRAVALGTTAIEFDKSYEPGEAEEAYLLRACQE